MHASVHLPFRESRNPGIQHTGGRASGDPDNPGSWIPRIQLRDGRRDLDATEPTIWGNKHPVHQSFRSGGIPPRRRPRHPGSSKSRTTCAPKSSGPWIQESRAVSPKNAPIQVPGAPPAEQSSIQVPRHLGIHYSGEPWKPAILEPNCRISSHPLVLESARPRVPASAAARSRVRGPADPGPFFSSPGVRCNRHPQVRGARAPQDPAPMIQECSPGLESRQPWMLATCPSGKPDNPGRRHP
eukprot:gene17327-biopygen9384